MPAQTPLVTVVIPAYNAAATIANAVGSVFAQTLDDYEIVVVDDASTDETRDLLATIDDPRLHVIELPANRGAAHARNVALQAARGEWIALLDADDTYRPTRLATLLSHASHIGHRAVIFDRLGIMVADRRGRLRLARTTPRRPGRRLGPQLTEVAAARFAADGFAVHPVFHRSLLDTGVTFPEHLRVAHDYAFLVMLLNQPGARLVQVDEPSYLWLVRAASLTGEADRVDRLRLACRHLLEAGLQPDLEAGVRQRLHAIDALAVDEQLRHELRHRQLRAISTRLRRNPRLATSVLRLAWNSFRYRARLFMYGIRPPSRRDHPAS
jgi:succinoglycan biosynthesis protein ExoO